MRARTPVDLLFPVQMEAAERARKIVEDLYQAYAADSKLLPGEWHSGLPKDEPARSRHIADFLAGMTDRYAEHRHAEIYGGGGG